MLRWRKTEITIGGKGSGGSWTKIVYLPLGFGWDAERTLYITGWASHPVIKWVSGAPNGPIIAESTNVIPGAAADCRCGQQSCGSSDVMDHRQASQWMVRAQCEEVHRSFLYHRRCWFEHACLLGIPSQFRAKSNRQELLHCSYSWTPYCRKSERTDRGGWKWSRAQ